MDFGLGVIVLLVILLMFALTIIVKQRADTKQLRFEDKIKTKFIKEMEMSLEQNVKYLVTAVEGLVVDVHTIKRGLYGDKDNGVHGLIDRQKADEDRLDNIENHINREKLKKKWWAAALAFAVALIEGIVHFWKELFNK